jgi:UDPglucose 6-dehydrogenase
MLLEEHANLAIHDPEALKYAAMDLADCEGNVSYEIDPYKAAEGAHAIAVLTEWKQFKDLDFEKLYKSMEKPAFIFDGRNLLDHQKLYKIGFNVYPLGQKALSHLDEHFD